ncbi:MAG: tetratricopeptide repeat protein [Planctomycetaceae bacterium]|nr:tetratricopeptide repeat protein [Planctomycetaceae bacterium]
MSEPAFSDKPIPNETGLKSSLCLQGERVSFTGTLASMTHTEAAGLVVQNGGTATDHISRQTTMLVVGEEGWPLEDNGQPSVKLQQAEHWAARGVDIQVVNESQWLALLGLNEHRDQVHRLYTPAMLSQILGLGVPIIRSWARAGLIQPVKRVHRLPYFDFREVSSARRLSELLDSGVPSRELEESLKKLPSVRRGYERPLEQLEILTHHNRVVVRDQHSLIVPRTGQRLLDFEGVQAEPESTREANPVTAIQFLMKQEEPVSPPGDWLVEGCRLYDAGRLHDALNAFRQAALRTPESSDVHFQLGECLYRIGHTRAALERYSIAAENDPDFLEAWTQIGCIHRELGEFSSAKAAFLKALELLPEYPDANFHLAETLLELGRSDQAQKYWKEYLRHDSRGPWADIARERIEAVSAGIEFDKPHV